MQILSAPKGTRDFYPEDMVMREHIFSAWQSTCHRFGFESFDGPLFEHLDVYTQKSGEGIEEQLYAFEDKAERRIALRPELTPTLARMVAARGSSLKKPVRWYSIPRLFRYEKMQRGRLREFFQLNMDILGIEDMTADAELIAAAAGMMQDLGFDQSDFHIHISSRTLLEELFLNAGVDRNALGAIYTLLDKRDKIPAEAFAAELTAIVPDSAVKANVQTVLAARSLDAISKIDNSVNSYSELRRLFALLSNLGAADMAEFDIGIVRGLAYYTGTVFEIFDTRRSLRAIAGGGRYDNLVGLYGGPATPAVGFAAGDVVLGELMKDKGIAPAQGARSDIYLVGIDSAWPETVMAQAARFRREGISTEYALKGTGIGKQMKLANAARARLVVFVGGEELERGEIKLKVMASGAEETLPLAEAPLRIKTILEASAS